MTFKSQATTILLGIIFITLGCKTKNDVKISEHEIRQIFDDSVACIYGSYNNVDWKFERFFFFAEFPPPGSA